MKSFRKKASRFFRESPSSDEKAANNDNSGVLFDAGIQAAVKKKPSRFFARRDDKPDRPLPVRRTNSSSSTLLAVTTNHAPGHGLSDEFDRLPDYDDEDDDTEASLSPFIGPHPHRTQRSVLDLSKLKKSSSNLGALKNKSSRLFRKKSNLHSSPPSPPPPQIPIDVPPVPKIPIKYTKNNGNSNSNSARTSRSVSTTTISRVRIRTISRPQPIPPYDQPTNLPLLVQQQLSRVPFEHRPGPIPQRPQRPSPLDYETLCFMRETNTRMVLLRLGRNNTDEDDGDDDASTEKQRGESAGASKKTTSTPLHTIESRLGLPMGYATPPPEAHVLASPLAARVPLHASLRVSRSSSGGVASSRFTTGLVKKCDAGKGKEKVAASVYAGDGKENWEEGDVGPVEQYRATKEGDWVLEKKVSRGKGGGGGMVFRDRWGGFHFVAHV